MATTTPSILYPLTWYLTPFSNLPVDLKTTLTPDLNSTTKHNSSDVSQNHTTVLSLPPNCRVVATEFTYIPWDNPSNLISLETNFLIVKLLAGVLVPLAAFLGLVLNVLNGLAFYKQGLRERINLLLFSLAVFDFLVEVRVWNW